MTPDLQEKALRLALETEGLLLMLRQRDDVPAEVETMLHEKTAELAALCAPAAEGSAKPQAAEPEAEEVISEPEPVAVAEPEPEPEPKTEPEPAKEPTPEPETAPAPEVAAASEPVCLGDKLAGAAARDLRKALTINDRYLFCRELFDMSNNVLNHALDSISAMSTFDDAKTYCFETLEMDPDNPATDYFLSFVAKHFAR